MKLSQIIFFIIVLCSLFVNASKAFADYAYTQIYLPSDVPSVVHCIFKDKHGFIWMGTRSGLFRYDGQNISEYNKDESSPLGNYISSNPQLSSSASFLRLNVLSSLN